MRLIDRDALPKYTGYALSANEVAMAVENAPTIDAIPVVRCKDCNYYKSWHDGVVQCTRFRIYTAEDDFCSSGAKMDGGADK